MKSTISILAICAATGVAADGHANCGTVTFSDVGWTDITATTAATSIVLEALGYETSTDILSVPVTYASMAQGDIDVFLGNWMPTMEGDIASYREAGTVDTVRVNLEGAKYTLATNAAGVAAGITATHIPFKGTPEALTETISGRIDWFFAPIVSALPLIKDGKLQVLAVGTPKRSDDLPNTPTTVEAGVTGSEYTFWVGMLAPSKTPKPVLDKLNAEVVKILNSLLQRTS